jgi:hypothetical protein
MICNTNIGVAGAAAEQQNGGRNYTYVVLSFHMDYYSPMAYIR